MLLTALPPPPAKLKLRTEPDTATEAATDMASITEVDVVLTLTAPLESTAVLLIRAVRSLSMVFTATAAPTAALPPVPPTETERLPATELAVISALSTTLTVTEPTSAVPPNVLFSI